MKMEDPALGRASSLCDTRVVWSNETQPQAQMECRAHRRPVLIGQGRRMPEVVKALGVHEVTYYRWRKEYGGMDLSQAKRLKELERENARLRKAVSDLSLDKVILQEATRGNF